MALLSAPVEIAHPQPVSEDHLSGLSDPTSAALPRMFSATHPYLLADHERTSR